MQEGLITPVRGEVSMVDEQGRLVLKDQRWVLRAGGCGLWLVGCIMRACCGVIVMTDGMHCRSAVVDSCMGADAAVLMYLATNHEPTNNQPTSWHLAHFLAPAISPYPPSPTKPPSSFTGRSRRT